MNTGQPKAHPAPAAYGGRVRAMLLAACAVIAGLLLHALGPSLADAPTVHASAASAHGVAVAVAEPGVHASTDAGGYDPDAVDERHGHPDCGSTPWAPAGSVAPVGACGTSAWQPDSPVPAAAAPAIPVDVRGSSPELRTPGLLRI